MTDSPSTFNAAENTPLVAPNFITEVIERDLSTGKYPRIVTRFPPDPSGYAHLGHIFASFLDFNKAQQYGGQFNLRMDEMSAALGRSQLGKLQRFKARRSALAAHYDAAAVARGAKSAKELRDSR